MSLDTRTLNSRMESDYVNYVQPQNLDEVLSEMDDAKSFAQVDIVKAVWTMELDKKAKSLRDFDSK